MKFKEMKDWQIKKLAMSFVIIVVIAAVFLTGAVSTLYRDRADEARYWNSAFQSSDEANQLVEELGGSATKVLVGTYLENIKEISLKSSHFRVVFLTWFRWEGDPDLDMMNHFRVYKGYENKMEVVKDYHEGDLNYQLMRCDVTVTKDYWTRRFPLESHQLRFYIESDYPVERVIFVPDTEESGLNSGLSIAGYNVKKHETGIFTMVYDNVHADPELEEQKVVTSEFVTAIELNRSSWGLYAKCFIALFGTTTWVLIVLFLCTYHHIDPLGMIPAALFGTVSNIMVGANLLPDALQMGLLEYVNIWGILTILAVTVSVITINRIRNKYEDRDFAKFYGRVMFYTIFTLTLAGHILMPVVSFMY